jgi:hypothetical protein
VLHPISPFVDRSKKSSQSEFSLQAGAVGPAESRMNPLKAEISADQETVRSVERAEIIFFHPVKAFFIEPPRVV